MNNYTKYIKYNEYFAVIKSCEMLKIDQIDDKGQTRNNSVYREDEPNIFDYVMNEPELLLGEVILTGFAIKF